MTIILHCDKSNPPLGALLAANLINSTKKGSIKVEWGQKNSVDTLCETPQEILRTIAQTSKEVKLYGGSPLERTQIDHWLCYTLGPLTTKNEFSSALSNMNKILGPVTYFVGNQISIADLAVFACLFANKQWQALISKKAAPTNVLRWYKFIESQDFVKKEINDLTPDILETLKKINEDVNNEVEQLTSGGRAREGKFVELPGAEMGKVVVRFPPEASGYLHIGHAKAALLNQYYQQAFEGKLIMRFDDTNPAKENTHFEEVILEDVAMLEIKPDRFTYTSDYFDLMLEYCEKMLKDGTAYVDDTDPEVMKQEREQKVESANRSNSIEKNFKMWEDMKKGTEYGQKCCVRAKIDMKSLNGCMRDPTIYRCKNEEHPRTGRKYKVYPTYDFACPIVDAIEGVTHTLRTMEYHDRDPQFYWFIECLGLRKPHIWEYSRLSMTNTVLSKRKLTWFVEQGLVDGWDDPRMPTVRGVLRRGMTVEGLKEFIIAQGSSRSVVFMEWDKIWAFNKKVIDPIAPRYTVVDYDTHVQVIVKGAKEECLSVPKHPKNPDMGTKSVWVGPKLIIDKADAESLKEGENATFIHWGNLMIKKINKKDGKVLSVEAEPNLDNKDYKKTMKVTFLCDTSKAKFTHTFCVYFDHIISKPLLGKDEDFKQFIGHETRKDLQVLGDPELRNLKKGDIIQIQRRGFFKVDVPFGERSPFTCKEQPIVLFYIPDGSAKDQFSTLSVKQEKPVDKADNKKAAATPKSGSGENKQNGSVETINQEIIKQGNIVRDLKSSKADKTKIDAEVKVLLKLKAEFKTLSGKDWKPDMKPTSVQNAEKPVNSGGDCKSSADLTSKINEQGTKVRELKTKKASKEEIDKEVKVLLELKAEYKKLTGTDFPVGGRPNDKPTKTPKDKKETKPKQEPKEEKETATNDDRNVKKRTRLGLEAKKEEDLPNWYSQVLTKGEMIEYYDVSGCYVYRPWSYMIWEEIKNWLDKEIKKLGVKNCYFPIFVSKAMLEKEKSHIADFSPEVAWVTKSGDSEMSEPIALRPTSETVMYPTFAKWIESYRDLPIKLNQWNNVVRWEFKHPQPFLRTREFLWQEGHTAYATLKEAKEEVSVILDLYAKVYTDLLAVPVIKGRKTEKEKFAGGDYTYTVEAYISASGRAIQGATSHHLGQNFSKMFEITYEDPETQQIKYVYQNSWGITTRTIGVMIMIHSDNQGLVLPPNVASVQVVIVPCGINTSLSEEGRANLQSSCDSLEAELKSADVRVEGDYRDNYSPGWKFNHWELKGVPIRIELGPKDIEKKQLVAVRRDTSEKITIPMKNAVVEIKRLLKEIHENLYLKASEDMKKHIVIFKNWSEFIPNLENKNLNLVPFCGNEECEDKIKADSKRDDSDTAAPSSGAKSLCIPLEQPATIEESDKCIHPSCSRKPQFYTLFGRSY